MMSVTSTFLSALGIVSALGQGIEQTSRTLFGDRRADMIAHDDFLIDRTTMLGTVTGPLVALPDHLTQYDTRNNRLLWTAMAQITSEIDDLITTFGTDRIGIILGTSTSGIEEGTTGYQDMLETGTWALGFRYEHQEIGSPADFLRDALGLSGPAYVISTACSSSGKAFASAQRLMDAGMCDAVIVGGVDSLCRLTVRGFDALNSISEGVCNPLSKNRDGINIGEGCALFTLRRDAGDIALMGVGETSDAHHPNAPHPDGIGAISAMKSALKIAGLTPDDISYINMHGTATPLNDSMESTAIAQIFGTTVAVSSTKPMTGHTLGAAGAIEAAILWLSLQHAADGAPLPRHHWDGAIDPDVTPMNLVAQTGQRVAPNDRLAMMSNSFAFGGSNVSVILGRGFIPAGMTS
ncbi:beta-ketoacyl-[acyl-carrier-protein] synthase family protein [Thalassospira sp. GB04J01]|uniref:beta-ketoacyl-[acyl-carrier-protein] synthase family protein n=1 Tax=Thalassospira sp. GB04J01 TaxID=1485225 RepID=UPI0018E0723D|nr:beta-ketoacyl-[acyl-carrier-protein] synthase family protein [Thalassospira sp. GB04J01]|tara:strand:- start:88348 stop:89571 length:1224 start_codon:yes stop_codon:yes gene_type:complete